MSNCMVSIIVFIWVDKFSLSLPEEKEPIEENASQAEEDDKEYLQPGNLTPMTLEDKSAEGTSSWAYCPLQVVQLKILHITHKLLLSYASVFKIRAKILCSRSSMLMLIPDSGSRLLQVVDYAYNYNIFLVHIVCSTNVHMYIYSGFAVMLTTD